MGNQIDNFRLARRYLSPQLVFIHFQIKLCVGNRPLKIPNIHGLGVDLPCQNNYAGKAKPDEPYGSAAVNDLTPVGR